MSNSALSHYLPSWCRTGTKLQKNNKNRTSVRCSVFVRYTSAHISVEPVIWELSFDENGIPDLEKTFLKASREVA